MNKLNNSIFIIFLSLFISFNVVNLPSIFAQTNIDSLNEESLNELELINLDFSDSLEEEEFDLTKKKTGEEGETISIYQVAQAFKRFAAQPKEKKIKLPLIGEISLNIIDKNQLKDILSAKGFDANIDTDDVNTVTSDDTNDADDEAAAAEKEAPASKELDLSNKFIFGQTNKLVKVGPLEISEVIFILKQTGKIKLFFNAKLFGQSVVVKSKGIKLRKEFLANLGTSIPEIESIELIAMPLKGQQTIFNLFKKDIEIQLDSASLKLSISKSSNTEDEEAASPSGKIGELQLQANIRFPRTKDDEGNIVSGKLFMLTKGFKANTMQTMLQLNDINIESTAKILGLNNLANILAKSPLNKIKFLTLKAKSAISNLLVPEREFTLKISGNADLSEFKINIPALDKINLKNLKMSGLITNQEIKFKSDIEELTIPKLGKLDQASIIFTLTKGSTTPQLFLSGKGILKDISYILNIKLGKEEAETNIKLTDTNIDQFLRVLNLNDIAALIAKFSLKDIQFPEITLSTKATDLFSQDRKISGKITGIADLSNFKINLPGLDKINLKELAIEGDVSPELLDFQSIIGDLTIPNLGEIKQAGFKFRLEKGSTPQLALIGKGILKDLDYSLSLQIGQDSGQANIELVDATIDKFLKVLNLNDIANLVATTPLKDIKFPKLDINTSIQSLSQKSISGKISGIADLSNFKINLPLANQINLKKLAVSGSIVKKGTIERSLNLKLKLGELTLPLLGQLNNGMLDLKLEKNKKPEIDLKGQGIFNLFGQAIPYWLQAEYKKEEAEDENVDPKSGFIFRGMLGSKALVDADEVPEDLDYMTDEQQEEAENMASEDDVSKEDVSEEDDEEESEYIEKDESKLNKQADNKKQIFEIKIGELSLGQPEFELNVNKKTMVIKSYSNLLQKAIGLIVNFEFNIDIVNQAVSISAQPNMIREEETGELATPIWQPFKDAANLQGIITALKAQTTDKGIQDFLTKLEDISIKDIKLEFEAGIAGAKTTKTTTVKAKMTENLQNLIGNVSITGSADFFGLAAISSVRLGKMQEGLDAAISFELQKALTKEERAAQLAAGDDNATSRKKGITLLDLLSIVPGLEAKIPKEKININGKQYDNPIRALLTLVETINTKINISTLPAPKMSISGAISIPVKNDNPVFKVIDSLVKIVEKGGTIPPSLQMSGSFNLASLKRLIELKASLTSGDMIKLAPTLPANAPATLKKLFEFELSNIALDLIARSVPSVGLGLSFNYKPPVLLGNITRDGKTNQALALATELNFTADTFDVAGKIEGIWNKPFGLSELSFGNMGLKFSKRYDEFVAEIAAAATVVAGIAAFIPSDFGIAGELTIGDSKTRAFINIGTDIKSSTIDIEGKNLGANELIMSGVKVINGYVRDYGSTVQKVTGLAPKQLPTQLIKNSLDKFVGPAMPIQLNDFNMKFSPLGAQIAGLETLPGFALGGRITVFGKEAQAIGNLSLQGMELSGYLPPLKIGALTIARSQTETSKKREKEVLNKINEFKQTFVEAPAEDNLTIEQELEEMDSQPAAKSKAVPTLTALPEGPNAELKINTSGDIKLVLNGLLQIGNIFKSETDIEISANRINLDTETKIGSGDCGFGIRIKSLGKDINVQQFLTDPSKLAQLGISIEFEQAINQCIKKEILKASDTILNPLKKLDQELQKSKDDAKKVITDIEQDIQKLKSAEKKECGTNLNIDEIRKELESTPLVKSVMDRLGLNLKGGNLLDQIKPSCIIPRIQLVGKEAELGFNRARIVAGTASKDIQSVIDLAKKAGESFVNSLAGLFEINNVYWDGTLGDLADGIIKGVQIKYTLNNHSKEFKAANFDFKNPIESAKNIAISIANEIKYNFELIFKNQQKEIENIGKDQWDDFVSQLTEQEKKQLSNIEAGKKIELELQKELERQQKEQELAKKQAEQKQKDEQARRLKEETTKREEKELARAQEIQKQKQESVKKVQAQDEYTVIDGKRIYRR